MKKLIMIIGLLTAGLAVAAQTQETLDKIEAAKIALITERLDLTPAQAEKFWPIYKEFTNRQLELRDEFQQLRRGHDPGKATEEENQRMLELGMQIKERQLDLEKSYSQRLQQVITTRQLMSLRKAESDFREMLMERVRQQQRQREQLRRQRMQNDENMQRKRTN